MAEDRFHLLGVSGSLREKSRTALAVRLLLDFAEEHGAETRMLICGRSNCHCTVPMAPADLPRSCGWAWT